MTSRSRSGPWLLIGLIVASAGANAQSGYQYERCRREAQEISGYYEQERQGVVSGAIRGGLAGAATGAAAGWVTGGNSGKAAKRGAILGIVIGGVKSASANKDMASKRETYQRALDRCLARTGN